MNQHSTRFDALEIGSEYIGESVAVTEADIIDFAKVWDPLPIHTDPEAGKAAFGSVTASGLHVLALKQRLLRHGPLNDHLVASFGYDEVRFLKPVRPNDTLTLRMKWIEKRRSESKPGRGIVKVQLSLVNQDGDPVLQHYDTVMVRTDR